MRGYKNKVDGAKEILYKWTRDDACKTSTIYVLCVFRVGTLCIDICCHLCACYHN